MSDPAASIDESRPGLLSRLLTDPKTGKASPLSGLAASAAPVSVPVRDAADAAPSSLPLPPTSVSLLLSFHPEKRELEIESASPVRALLNRAAAGLKVSLHF